jgi:hypothetical protein
MGFLGSFVGMQIDQARIDDLSKQAVVHNDIALSEWTQRDQAGGVPGSAHRSRRPVLAGDLERT